MVGFEGTDRGDRSTERRELCKGEGESDSNLATPLLSLATLGVAGEALWGVSDKADLSSSKSHKYGAVLRMHWTGQAMWDIQTLIRYRKGKFEIKKNTDGSRPKMGTLRRNLPSEAHGKWNSNNKSRRTKIQKNKSKHYSMISG